MSTEMPNQGPVALLVVGGFGRSVSNTVDYLLEPTERGFTGAVTMAVDMIDRDPHTAAPDGRDHLAIAESPRFAQLEITGVTALLEDIKKRRAAPEGLGFIDPRVATQLLDRRPSSAEGSGQEPLLMVVALHGQGQAIGIKLDAFVAGARKAAGSRAPTYVVIGGMGGGIGAGGIVRIARLLRERIGPDAAMVCIAAEPMPWMRLDKHAKPDIQAKMRAKAVATQRTLEANSELFNVVWVVGDGPGPLASVPPQEGVAPAVATFLATMIQSPGRYAAPRANWQQVRSGGAPFSTAAVGQLNAPLTVHAARIAHETASSAWASVVELGDDGRAAAHEAARAFATEQVVLLEARQIVDRNPGEMVPDARRESTDHLLRLGTPDGVLPPDLSPELGDPKALGRKPDADDVRSRIADLRKEDARAVRKHLEANRQQALVDTRERVADLLGRRLPAVLGADPSAVAGLSAQFESTMELLNEAKARLSADVAEYDEQERPVQAAEERLREILEPLSGGVSRRTVARAFAAAQELIEAQRWQAATASLIDLFGQLGATVGEYHRTFQNALNAMREARHEEQRHHADAVKQLRTLAAMPHISLAFAPGGPAEREFDRAIAEETRGSYPSMERRVLASVTVVLEGDAKDPAAWRLGVVYPGPKGQIDAVLASRSGDAVMPADLLSSMLVAGTSDWRGTRANCVAAPLADCLGYRLDELASVHGKAPDVMLAASLVDDRLRELGATLQPMAPIRPGSADDGLPAPEKMVFADTRPARTRSGALVQSALAKQLSEMTGGDASPAADSPHPGTLTVVANWHGLALQDFVLMRDSVDTYVSRNEHVETDAAGVDAHQVEQAAWRLGLVREPRLLHRTVLALLRDRELLDAAGRITAFQQLGVAAGARVRDVPMLALQRADGTDLLTLAPVGDEPAAIVELCRQGRNWRTTILDLAERVERKALMDHGGDRAAADAAYVQRLRALDFVGTETDVDGLDLQLALMVPCLIAKTPVLKLHSPSPNGPLKETGPSAQSA